MCIDFMILEVNVPVGISGTEGFRYAGMDVRCSNSCSINIMKIMCLDTPLTNHRIALFENTPDFGC